MKLILTITCLLTAAALAQASPDDGALRSLEGVVRHDPLRIEVRVGDWFVVTRPLIAPSLRSVLEQDSLEGQTLEFRWDGMRVFTFVGQLSEDVVVLDGVGLGSSTVGKLGTEEEVLVTGVEVGTGPRGTPLPYYHVRSGDLRGLVPASSFAAGATARELQFFEPDGEVLRARVESHTPRTFRQTADGLAGAALIRMSEGFWNADPVTGVGAPRLGKSRPNTLALAIRFYDPAAGGPSPTPRPGDLDLQLTSWYTPAETSPHDFFATAFYPSTRLQLEGQEVSVRVVPARTKPQGPNRVGSLLAVVEAGQAVFHLEVRARKVEIDRDPATTRRAQRRKARPQNRWVRLATITLEAHLADFDREQLRYHATTGRGFEHWLPQQRYRNSLTQAATRLGEPD